MCSRLSTIYVTLVSGLLIVSAFAKASGQEKLDKAMSEQIKVGDDSARSQANINQLSQAEKSLYDQYKIVIRQIENTKAYNEQMQTLIVSQGEEMKNMMKQIEDLKETNKEILPLMSRMVTNLEKFIELDTPFLEDERKQRVSELVKLLDRADVSTSEKFRRILEAYQIENEYGRTLEAYRGQMKVGENSATVDFLRVGRTGLYYQTLDQKSTYAWSPTKREWVDLEGEFTDSIRKGIRMARKQMTPDLIKLPIETDGVTQ